MPAQVFAHTPDDDGRWHLLADHLAGTAERAARFAKAFNAEELGRTAGWLHDAGKCSQTFSAYLAAAAKAPDIARRKFPSRDHKRPGALRAAGLHPIAGPLLATTILGHHGGMHDCADVRSRLAEAETDSVVADTLNRFDEFVGPPPFPLSTAGPPWCDERPITKVGQSAFLRDIEMLWRFVFSALVDADWLDTEAHFDRERASTRRPDRPLEGLPGRLDQRRSRLLAGQPDSPVNRARTQIYDTVVARAAEPPGLFALAAPTGAGKTQIGLGWALAHARAHGLRRVVTAVPFITVTDQVAQVYRDLLDGDDDPVVIEHHSQVVGGDGLQKLASENWDAPVVVTTTVRLFESLFSNRPSDCRRLHRLARSVIIIDEAQAIPVEVLDPVVDGLRALCDRFGASVLIMTATQPTLEHLASTQGRRAEDLLPQVENWAGVFQRTTAEVRGELSHGEVARLVTEHHQCLCIVNTINDAREITAAAGAEVAVIHLSTMLRPADRRERLIEIHRRLGAGEECRVVSTQLVEAGVDLDFPIVLRAMAPLPSLAQADGRCNRNGSIAGGGSTIVFNLVGGRKPPGAYYTAGTAHTEVMLRDKATDFRHPATVATWYGGFLLDPSVVVDKENIQRSRAALDYRTTADHFHMIDDDTQPVVVPWGPGHPRSAAIARLLGLLRDGKRLDPDTVRELQDVTVSVRKSVADRALRLKIALPLTDYLVEWRTDAYDDRIGLVFETPPMEPMIW